MKVSIIIPTFNEEKTIADCLLSLAKQTYKDFEIIVVDDGSTDQTLQNLKDFKIKTFSQNHKGPAVARNLGAEHSKGKILVFVDADMTFDFNFIKNLINPILEKKSKGTFSRDEFVANWDNIWARCWNINSNLPPKRRLSKNYPEHQKVFRSILKKEFDKVNGFSKGGYTDDWTLSEKLGYEATVSENAIYYHKNPDTLTEIFKQAKWIGKRDYKFGLIGEIYTVLKSLLPISLLIGLVKSTINLNFYFLIFKVVYDFGIFVGILEMIIVGKYSK
ncbi:MAG: glycosyltransferase family 2 protein [Candidatus Woesebacteria bacterium]|nr:MAG: glycosyltransferase family 2 protein [Candidatus Woesebacteria bacterium]